MNATHIKVQWDKPFALPEFDVKSYTLSTLNTTSGTGVPTTETVNVTSGEGPYIHYMSNGGIIPRDCFDLNFTLTAANDIGTSDEGFTSGGFPIGNDITIIILL